MKALLLLASLLPLAAARAQTRPTPLANPSPAAKAKASKTAEQRAETYQGPKVVDNSKALGHKMIQKSRPTDGLIISSKELEYKMTQKSKPADGLPKQDRPRPVQPR